MGWQIMAPAGSGVTLSVRHAGRASTHHLVFNFGVEPRSALGWHSGDRLRFLWGTGEDAGKVRVMKHEDGFKLSKSHQITIVAKGRSQTAPSEHCDWVRKEGSGSVPYMEITLPSHLSRRRPAKDVTSGLMNDPRRSAA